MKERLVELIYKSAEEFKDVDCTPKEAVVILADYLIENGVIVPPKELYSIVVNKLGMCGTVSKAIIEHLPLYKIRNPEKYGYYRTREEAEQKLKERDRK